MSRVDVQTMPNFSACAGSRVRSLSVSGYAPASPFRRMREKNSNVGFPSAWWDMLLGTYQPRRATRNEGHE